VEAMGSRPSSLSWEVRSGGKPFSGDDWGLVDYGSTSRSKSSASTMGWSQSGHALATPWAWPKTLSCGPHGVLEDAIPVGEHQIGRDGHAAAFVAFSTKLCILAGSLTATRNGNRLCMRRART
jgi:hypothetical protein